MGATENLLTAWVIGSLTIATWVVLTSFWRLIKVWRQTDVDLFDMARYINMILHFTVTIVAFFMNIFMHNNIPYSVLYWYMFDINIYVFILLNFTWWIILLVHIHLYSKISVKVPYKIMLRKIKTIEKISIIFIFFIHTLLFIIMLVIWIFEGLENCACLYWKDDHKKSSVGIWKISNVMQKFLYYSKGVLFLMFFIGIMALSSLYLLWLRKNLNFYYGQTKLKI